MSRTANPNEQQMIQLVDVTAIRLQSLEDEEANFRELWRFLNTIERFRELDADDQVLFFRLALTASDGATKTGYETYSRAVLQSLEVLNRFPDEYEGVRALFSESSVYERVGVWDTTAHKRNGRIAAVKKYLDAAVHLGLIDDNHLDDMKTRKIKRAPTPASEDAVTHAVEHVIGLITARTGWWKVLSFRDLAILDWKSYGLRSIEMAAITRGDFLSNPDGVPIHRSKTEQGKGTLILSETSRRITLTYLRLFDEYLESKNRPAPAGSDPLFMGMRGAGLSSAAISSAVSSLLPAGARPHDLRARMGTLIGRLRRNNPDIAAALRIELDSVSAYAAAADASGISADMAAHHALVGLSSKALESLEGDQFTTPLHGRSSKVESPCWLPDWFDGADEPDAA